MKSGIPLQCRLCTHQFTCAADIEKHQITEHPTDVTKLKCPVCPRYYVTDLFYREHLLSHLGEIQSMTSLLEKGIFLAPACSSDTCPRMGPLLQRVAGGILSFDMPSYGSCQRCAKGTSKAAIDEKNDLLLSLTEKFSREGRLYHLRVCLQKDMDLPDLEKSFDLADFSVISDDEDLSADESLDIEKDEPETKKLKLKNGDKKLTEGLCYYCRQAKQLSFDMPSYGSCQRCAKGTSKAAIDEKNDLLLSLTEKFSREGRLYVNKNSVLDTSIGAIIDDSVYMCVKCNGLHFGKEHILKHLRVCLQKDMDLPDLDKSFDLTDSSVVICLSQPNCSPADRIYCPKCTESCCSISSLRRHFVLRHGIFAYYSAPGA
ncbi:unnamed protein product [Gongylonema pulchrum]|uniref:C2H2-type domain-containing protein n=1 Tax=Gongylonema pulchrum TaxID=637853 RepID=A0A183DRU2_9BILA|nr:unnamed protein product [Gongylonema pulchrum]